MWFRALNGLARLGLGILVPARPVTAHAAKPRRQLFVQQRLIGLPVMRDGEHHHRLHGVKKLSVEADGGAVASRVPNSSHADAPGEYRLF